MYEALTEVKSSAKLLLNPGLKLKRVGEKSKLAKVLGLNMLLLRRRQSVPDAYI